MWNKAEYKETWEVQSPRGLKDEISRLIQNSLFDGGENVNNQKITILQEIFHLNTCKGNKWMSEKIGQLQARNKKLEGALQYYADCEDMQEVTTRDGGRTWAVDDGYGGLASEVLEEVIFDGVEPKVCGETDKAIRELTTETHQAIRVTWSEEKGLITERKNESGKYKIFS